MALPAGGGEAGLNRPSHRPAPATQCGKAAAKERGKRHPPKEPFLTLGGKSTADKSGEEGRSNGERLNGQCGRHSELTRIKWFRPVDAWDSHHDALQSLLQHLGQRWRVRKIAST